MADCYLVLYDLSSPKALRSAVRICRDRGLRRIQRSVFAGRLNRFSYQEICRSLQPLATGGHDSVLVLEVSQAALQRMVSFPEDSLRECLSAPAAELLFL